MERFIRRENIKRYRKLLREVKDDPGRRLIQKLLLEEEQKESAVSDDLAPSARHSSSSPM
jgi:hypothetical protein